MGHVRSVSPIRWSVSSLGQTCAERMNGSITQTYGQTVAFVHPHGTLFPLPPSRLALWSDMAPSGMDLAWQ